MNRVILQPDGVLEADDGHPVGDKVLRCLGQQLQLAEGCTLRTFFHLIQSDALYAELIDFFEILKKQYRQCPPQACCWPDYRCLEFGRVVAMIGYPGPPRMEIYFSLQGLTQGQGGAQESAEEIRQLPLAVLLDMPLRLGKLRHRVFGDRLDTFEFDTVYTLFEFVDGMAWNLSFHGASAECLTRS